MNEDLSAKSNPDLFFAGQITGVEGYVESAAMGLLCGYHVRNRLLKKPPVIPPPTTVMGALCRYLVTPNKDFQPMNANYGILEGGYEGVRDKKERKRLMGLRALEAIETFRAEALG